MTVDRWDLRTFDLPELGQSEKASESRAVEYLGCMYPYHRLTLVLLYSQQGNNSPILIRNCP